MANWDTLHLRLASSVRDGVSAANVDGAELTVADRDAYLNYAYTQYVRLLDLYNPSAIDKIVEELFIIAPITVTLGVATLPSDFGYIVDVRSSSAVVTLLKSLDWLKIKDTATIQDPPSATNVYATLSGTNLLILPQVSTVLDIGYIQFQVITQGGITDISLGAEHWDTIIALAKVQYYSDKQEFDVANAFRQDAIVNSPFKIGVGK